MLRLQAGNAAMVLELILVRVKAPLLEDVAVEPQFPLVAAQAALTVPETLADVPGAMLTEIGLAGLIVQPAGALSVSDVMFVVDEAAFVTVAVNAVDVPAGAVAGSPLRLYAHDPGCVALVGGDVPTTGTNSSCPKELPV